MNKPLYAIAIVCTFLVLLQGCKKDGQEDPEPTDAIPCLPTNLTANLVAFYPFSNSSLNDFSGNSIHLTNNTTAKAAADRNGNANCAFEFDNYPNNVDSLFAANTQVLNGMPAFSVSLWYQPLDTVVHASTPKREYMVLHENWGLELYDCRKAAFGMILNSTTSYSVWDNNTLPYGTPDICQQEQKLRTGGWHHLVVTMDKAGNMAKIYRDNVLQEGEAGYTNGSPFSSIPNIANLVIGSSFTGRMDDIAIFNKALTDAEITSLFNMDACCGE